MKSTLFRYLEVFIFVIMYIALGFALHLDANQYLLLGIPLTILFQTIIRKKSLYNLWQSDAESFRIGIPGLIIAFLLCIMPVINLIHLFNIGKLTWVDAAYNSAMIFGSFGVGFCVAFLNRNTLKQLLLTFLIIGAISGLFQFFAAYARSVEASSDINFNWIYAFYSLITYLPICFVLEEVTFRGMLDSHVHHNDKRGGWFSAFYISALWGLWHLPIVPYEEPIDLIIIGIAMIIVHSFIGIPLSFFWRRSKSLLVPSFGHAIADAIRNALLKI